MSSPSKPSENREFSRLLSETADLMEIAAQDSFRIRSYRNAAAAIEGYPERVADILADPERKVTDIPGIGKGLAAVLGEIAATGSCAVREKLMETYPPTALEFLKIQGLGPKTIALLFEHFRVTTMDDLERLCREQKLRDLPRLGAKTEEKVLRSIEQYKMRTGRFLVNFAENAAAQLKEYLGDIGGIDEIVAAGSLRRGRETVGDLDLLVIGTGAGEALAKAAVYPRAQEVLGKGPNKTSIQVGREGLQVDVRAVPPHSKGAALQYFTGSKEHNVAVRQRAIKMGLKLNEYGLFRIEDESRVEADSEEAVYGALGLAWIPPEMRENQGEIELAAEGRLPALVQLGQIRGDLHMHTTETDGRATLEEMAEAARERGYEYIAITDHSKALAMANGLDEARVVAFAERVRRLNEDGSLGIRIFSGIECDIMKDGAMDLEWDALGALDFVIGSVHNNMNLERAAMTDRMLMALECPYLRMLGHPTGRMLLAREPFDFDFEKIVDAAVRRGVWFEVNSSPERLDLSSASIRIAKARGARFAISTDAHHPKHLMNMRYGVTTARRGWLTASDVMNALPLAEFEKAIGKGERG